VQSVYEEGIAGCSDRSLFDTCRSEGRCLITMDLDFSDVTRFPPSDSSGIVVFRVPKGAGIIMLKQLVKQYLKSLSRISGNEQLCIVEPGRIRLHQAQEKEPF